MAGAGEWQGRAIWSPMSPKAGDMGHPTLKVKEKSRSFAYPPLHPNDEDLSLGTPVKKTLGAPCAQDDSMEVWQRSMRRVYSRFNAACGKTLAMTSAAAV